MRSTLKTRTDLNSSLVRVVEEVTAGLEAIFEAKASKERVSVLLKIADTTARVQVSSHDIEPVSDR